MNTVIQIEQKIKNLTSKIYKLRNISTFSMIAGLFVGVAAMFFFGPTALGIGAAFAVILVHGVEVFAVMRERECTNEVLDLESKNLLSESEAEKLKKDIKAMNCGRPKKT